MSTAETTENYEYRSLPKLGASVKQPQLPFSSDQDSPLRATVAEDDTRNLKTVEDAKTAFRDYLKEKENQVLVFEDQKQGDMMVLPHEHRWSPSYRRRTYARMKAVERYAGQKWGDTVPTTLLTLTTTHTDSNGNPRPFESVLTDLKEAWPKARKVIDRETEGTDTEYLAIYEPHASGYPHLHVVVFGVSQPSIGEKVSEYWANRYVEGAKEKGQSCEVSRDHGDDLSNPAAYVMKYLSKSLARENDEQTAIEAMPTTHGYTEFSALMWATGSRTYSMSQGLTQAVKESKPESKNPDMVERDWELVGTESGIDPGLYTGEKAEKLRKFVAGSRNQQRPPRQTDGLLVDQALSSFPPD